MEIITAKQIHAEFMKEFCTGVSNDEWNILNEIGYVHAVPQELQEKFPYRKIIHNNKIIKLCEKYGLVYGSIDRYVDSIPEKNIKELVRFEKDFPYCNFYERKRKFLFFDEYHKWYTLKRKSDCENVSEYNWSKSFNYFIVAPKEMMVTDSEINNSIFKIKDPIILASLTTQSGFENWNIIVTAWGDESDIEEFKNPINN